MDQIELRFAARLRSLRQAAGFSQRELAQRLGKPQASLSRLEAGRRSASLRELYALAAALRLTLAELLDEPSAAPSARAAVQGQAVSLEETLSFLAAYGVRFLGKPVSPSMLRPRLESALLAALTHAQHPRIFETLPSLLSQHQRNIDWPGLIEAAASTRLQNRLGAAVAMALETEDSPILKAALERLEPWRLDRVEFLGPAPRTTEGRQMLAHRTPAWLRAWHFIGVPHQR